jgi:hypothetical protein
MKKYVFWGMGLFILSFVGCGDGTIGNGGTAYYYQTGTVHPKAYSLISANVGLVVQSGLPAQKAVAYCNQYPVYGKNTAQSGCTRFRLERALEQITVMDVLERSKFLKLLDSGGAAFQMFTLDDGDVVYCYAEKEEGAE